MTRADRPAVAGHAEQPMPSPRPGVVGAHDLVIAEISGPDAMWDWDPQTVAAVVALLAARAAVGLERYGQPLCHGNGRDSLRDAIEEGCDQVVYIRNAMRDAAEVGDESLRSSLFGAYEAALRVLISLVYLHGSRRGGQG